MLPHIPGTPPTTRHDSGNARKSSAGRKKEHSEKKDQHSKGNSKDLVPSSSDDLGLSGTKVQRKASGQNAPANNIVDMRGVIQGAIRDASSDIHSHHGDHHGDRLLRPIAGFAGYNGEMRDLAAVIAKVGSGC